MPETPTANLQQIAGRIRETLAVKHQARERAYVLSREVIRNAANTIRAVHREEIDTAQALLSANGDLLRRMQAAVAAHPDIRYAGYVDDAQKEYAEAAITMALVSRSPVPGPEDLGVDPSPYLNGLAEAASEMRRHLLDSLRRNRVGYCEDILSSMDDIYNVLVTIDFPDAITGGLRRTTDQLRGVLERTRGDLTLAIVQNRLAEKLARAEAGLTQTP